MNKPFRRYGLVSIIITAIGYILVAWLVDWPPYFVAVTALSVTTFLLYGLDKFEAARPGSGARQRVPENLFHLLALLGGFPGGWLGRFVFWHKIRKRSFWLVLIISTFIHILIVLSVQFGLPPLVTATFVVVGRSFLVISPQ